MQCRREGSRHRCKHTFSHFHPPDHAPLEIDPSQKQVWSHCGVSRKMGVPATRQTITNVTPRNLARQPTIVTHGRKQSTENAPGTGARTRHYNPRDMRILIATTYENQSNFSSLTVPTATFRPRAKASWVLRNWIGEIAKVDSLCRVRRIDHLALHARSNPAAR